MTDLMRATTWARSTRPTRARRLSYSYNALDNLTRVTQGAQTRPHL